MKRYLVLLMIGIITESSSAAQETVVTPRAQDMRH